MSIALQRIQSFFDPGSFELLDDLTPTIHILGAGRVNGRKVFCCAGVPEPARVNIHECFRRKIQWLEMISQSPAPVVWFHDAPPQVPGGRTPIPSHSDELLASDHGVGRSFYLQARLIGVVPQISVLFGDTGAAQSFSFRLVDFTVMLKGTHAWIGRPDAVKLMLGKSPDPEELGGAEMHCRISGVGDVLATNETEALIWVRRCLALLPEIKGQQLPRYSSHDPAQSCDRLSELIPSDLNKPFDIKPVIDCLIDRGSWVGIQDLHASEALTGLAKIGGSVVGIVANNSGVRGGVPFPTSCRKMTRFIRFCDDYQIPLLFLADNPGLMVGKTSEQEGMLTAASDLLTTLAHISTKRVCLVVRKAYTVGLYVMDGPGFDPSCFWATPQASISVFGPKALDYFLADRDPSSQAVQAIEEMRSHALNPQHYADKGYLSAVIPFKDLRKQLLSAFCVSENYVQDQETQL